MSSLIAKVVEIQNCDSLHIVRFECYGQILSMMSLDLNKSIKIGTKVKLQAKPTHIAIGKNFTGDISSTNQLKSTINQIKNGKLLTSLKLDFYGTSVESIITLNSSKRMNLKVGDEVTAFIKASELSIGEVLFD